MLAIASRKSTDMPSKPLKIAALGFTEEQNFRIMGILIAAVDADPDRFVLAPADGADFVFVNVAAGLPVPRARLISHYYGDRAMPADAGRLAMSGALKAQTVQQMLELAEGSLRQAGGREATVLNMVDTSAKIAVAKELSLKALVVDDSLAVRTQVSEALHRGGVESVQVATAEEALARMKNERFDLVFLDIVMPGMDGLAACKLVRAGKWGADTTIIMLTGQSAPASRVAGALAGCDAYLTKPITLKDLYSSIDRAIHKRAELRGVPISGLQSKGLSGFLKRISGL
jgi:CheY-like chemotaxis protein